MSGHAKSNQDHDNAEEVPAWPSSNLSSVDVTLDSKTLEETELSKPAEEEIPAMEPGSRVGRYLVIQRIGMGAMGQVYAAFDPELDRKVALKLLHTATNRPGSSKEGQVSLSDHRQRLLSEAKALSQLAHPNVVAVHDVGTLDDQVFVAMEFVEGQPLGDWANQRIRGLAEVLEVYIQAGRGLAAAHAAGLVHRDFKPQNAILGADGRVRVLDFGLARGRRKKAPPVAAALQGISGAEQPPPAGDDEHGTVVGSPAYMAPEVIAGEPAGERSDQFSFCVSLCQAVVGKRPYDGRTLRELAEGINTLKIPEAPGRPMPGWLRRALLRGMSVDPARRFPTMDALLLVLERRDPQTRHQRLAVRAVALASTILLVGAGTTYLANRQVGLCRGAEQRLVGVWDGARQHAVQASLLATRVSYAADTWSRVKDGVNRYTRDWVAMREDACMATQVRGEQSGEMLDLRMRCLDDRLRELNAVLGVLGNADAEVTQRAVPAVERLVPLSMCADRAALLSAVPLPTDPAVRKDVALLQEELEQVQALERTGRFTPASNLLEPLEPRINAVGYKPLEAELQLLKGLLLVDRAKYADAIPVLEQASLHAARVGHAQVIASAAQALVSAEGEHLARFEPALVRAHEAQVMLHQVGLFESLGGRLMGVLGVVLLKKGDLGKAAEHLQQALAMCTQQNAAESCSPIMLNLGRTLYRLGRFDEGQARMREAMAATEKSLGGTHPQLGSAMISYGVLLNAAGRYDEALEWMDRALEVYRKAVDEDHPLMGEAMTARGNTLWWKEDFVGALKCHQRALEIRLKQFGRAHPSVAIAETNVGMVLESMGKLDEAKQHFQACLEINTRALGPEHHQTGWCLNNRASILIAQRQYEQAQADLERVVGIWTKQQGPNHPNLCNPLMSLSEIAMHRHDAALARTHLERALQIHGVNNLETRVTVSLHIRLARVLWLEPSLRSRALQHAQLADTMAIKLGLQDKSEHKEIAAWLAEHRQ